MKIMKVPITTKWVNNDAWKWDRLKTMMNPMPGNQWVYISSPGPHRGDIRSAQLPKCSSQRDIIAQRNKHYADHE